MARLRHDILLQHLGDDVVAATALDFQRERPICGKNDLTCAVWSGYKTKHNRSDDLGGDCSDHLAFGDRYVGSTLLTQHPVPGLTAVGSVTYDTASVLSSP